MLEWVAVSFFPTQESNPGLLYCRQVLYQLSHQGSLLRGKASSKTENSGCCFFLAGGGGVVVHIMLVGF